MYFVRLLVSCFMLEQSLAVVDYCDIDRKNLSDSSSGIQFTKELSSSEFGVLGSFKSLHCCARAYRSIEWFKDSKAYPWPGDVSSFILYPESANQTIYSQALGSVDKGIYTCRVANDSRLITHATEITVFDMRKNYMDKPLPTYALPAEQFVRLGQTARLFCEAFVGKIDLPDATNEVWWERPGFNMSTTEGRRYRQISTSREKGQVVGAYLFIEGVTLLDFGEYICSISNTEDQVIRLSTILREKEWEQETPVNKIPWLKLQFLVLFALTVAALIICYKHYSSSVYLSLKLWLCQRPENDGKEYDVLVCHCREDSDFAVNVLAATLQNQYNFSVTICQISEARAGAEVQLASNMSRRLLVILSSSICQNSESPTSLLPLFNQLTDMHPSIICVCFKPLQENILWKTQDGSAMRRLLARCTVINWQVNTPYKRRRFWTSLRLSLPLPIPQTISDNIEQNMTVTTTKAKLSTLAKSSESLEVLV